MTYPGKPTAELEAVARALATSDGVPLDAPLGDYIRNAHAAIAAMPFAETIARLEAENAGLREAAKWCADLLDQVRPRFGYLLDYNCEQAVRDVRAALTPEPRP